MSRNTLVPTVGVRNPGLSPSMEMLSEGWLGMVDEITKKGAKPLISQKQANKQAQVGYDRAQGLFSVLTGAPRQGVDTGTRYKKGFDRNPHKFHPKKNKNIKDVPYESKEWYKFSLQERYNDPRRIAKQNKINKKHVQSVANQPKLNELLHGLKIAKNQGNDKLVNYYRKEIKRWTV